MSTPHTFIGAGGEFRDMPPQFGREYSKKELEEAVGGEYEVVGTRWGNKLVLRCPAPQYAPANIAASEMCDFTVYGDVVLSHPDLLPQ
jgi:hypothetical protein